MSEKKSFVTMGTIQGLPFRRYESPLALELADLWACKSDLGFAAGAFATLLQLLSSGNNNLMLHGNLYSAGVIRYRRCVTSGVRKSLFTRVEARLSDQQRKVHDLLYNVANKHVAHSVNAFEETQVGLQFTSADPATATIRNCLPVSSSLANHNPAQISEFLQHVLALGVLVDHDSSALREQIVAEAQKVPVAELLNAEPLDFAQINDDDAGKPR